jgi:ABC-type transporter MlaC component
VNNTIPQTLCGYSKELTTYEGWQKKVTPSQGKKEELKNTIKIFISDNKHPLQMLWLLINMPKTLNNYILFLWYIYDWEKKIIHAHGWNIINLD